VRWRLVHALGLGMAFPALAASDGTLVYPVDVAVSARGEVYVADPGAHALLKLENGAFRVVARGPGKPRTPLFGIRQIAPTPQGDWVASDPASMRLYRIDRAGQILPLPDDRLVTPWGVAVDPSGAVLTADRTTQKLRRVAPDGTVTDLASVRAARAILVGKSGALLVLTDQNLFRLVGTQLEPVILHPPFRLALDATLLPDGGYAVTDGYSRTIWRIEADGRTAPLAKGGDLVSPEGIAVAPDGDLLVADPRARAVFRVTLRGEVRILAR
jgi:sugar lactone lactonase YvrE